jgi:hypothetical protein
MRAAIGHVRFTPRKRTFVRWPCLLPVEAKEVGRVPVLGHKRTLSNKNPDSRPGLSTALLQAENMLPCSSSVTLPDNRSEDILGLSGGPK